MEETVGVNVIVDFPGGNVYDDLTVCFGNTVYINAIDGWTYNWYPAATLTNPQIPNPGASPLQTTTYFVDITNICGEGTDQITVHVIKPDVIPSNDGTICAGNGFDAYATGSVSYPWQPVNLASPAFSAQNNFHPITSPPFFRPFVHFVDNTDLWVRILADIHGKNNNLNLLEPCCISVSVWTCFFLIIARVAVFRSDIFKRRYASRV